MTIRKGEDWGREGPLPPGTEICPDDASLHAALNRESVPSCLGLLTGDLARTVAASGRTEHFVDDGQVLLLPVDLGIAEHEHGSHRFVSHLVLRRSWLLGPVIVISNAQFIDNWDVAPRSHPNDGWLDVTEVLPTMGIRQRIRARSLLPTAGHLPHPSIRTNRIREGTWEFRRALDVWVDGVRVGRTRSLRVRCEPDALTVCI
jgi:hypothetical protein